MHQWGEYKVVEDGRQLVVDQRVHYDVGGIDPVTLDRYVYDVCDANDLDDAARVEFIFGERDVRELRLSWDGRTTAALTAYARASGADALLNFAAQTAHQLNARSKVQVVGNALHRDDNSMSVTIDLQDLRITVRERIAGEDWGHYASPDGAYDKKYGRRAEQAEAVYDYDPQRREFRLTPGPDSGGIKHPVIAEEGFKLLVQNFIAFCGGVESKVILPPER